MLADLDADGFLDLVAGNSCSGMGCAPSGDGGPEYIHWNDGAGGLTDTWMLPFSGATHTRGVVVGDVDGDGDPDLVFGNGGDRNSPANMLYLNRGDRVFERAYGTFEESPFPMDWDDTVALFLDDMDGDGDPDLLTVNAPVDPGASPRAKIHGSLIRHLWTPYMARIGHGFPMQMYGAENGAALFGALGRASNLALPFGIVGLDPLTLFPVALLGPPAGGRVAELEFQIPREPALVGVTLYLQAMVFSPFGPRVTNVIGETLLAH